MFGNDREPGIPLEMDAEKVGDDEEFTEVVRADRDTPITVNTSSGREMLIKFSDDCFILATLRADEETALTAAALVPLVMVLANMRYGGMNEAAERWKEFMNNLEVSGG